MYHPKSPEIVVTKEDFGMDEVTISLEWLATQELTENSFESLASYNVNVRPSIGVKVVTVDAMKANLTILYNTLYTVSVTVIFCDQINTSTIIKIYYGKLLAIFSTNYIIIIQVVLTTMNFYASKILCHLHSIQVLACI